MADPTPIVLDCDPGHDDAVAILLALGVAEVDLLGVTTTFGNCAVEDATRNAQRVLALAGRADVPVAVGAAGPLVGDARARQLRARRQRSGRSRRCRSPTPPSTSRPWSSWPEP